MFLKLNRFMTTEEVRRDYRVPDEVAGDVLPSLPAVAARADGTRMHLESEVDEFLAEYARRKRQADAQASPSASARVGRKVETLEIALFADELRKARKTWKEVLRECRNRWPDSEHVKNLNQVRATHRRHIGRAGQRAN